ncbi:glycoside hydrolase [Clostridiaceae bacterium M8S5]|nr:glycoside hydrolase [Clostridiaceae bacterium M8S5]
MKICYFKKSFVVFLVLFMFTGCATKINHDSSIEREQLAIVKNKDAVKYQVDPETFSLQIIKDDDVVPISAAMQNRNVANYNQNEKVTKWSYPKEQVDVAIKAHKDYLHVTITSSSNDDNKFLWPKITGETFYLPFGEGKRIPAEDSTWTNYLRSKEFDVLEQLSMPFWATEQGEHTVLFILENPYRNTMNFSDDNQIEFVLSHGYPKIDDNKINSFRIYIADKNPTSVAKIYRDYVKEKGDFITFKEKAKKNPNIERLYGAPHIYLASEYVISSKNINWQAFRKSLNSDVIKYILSYTSKLESGKEMQTVINEIRNQDYVNKYQKNVVCRFLSDVLRQDNFFDSSIFLNKDEFMKTAIEKNNKDQATIIQLNKHALSSNLPNVFEDAQVWMNDETVDLIKDLKNSGIEKAWIGLHSWEQAYAKPDLTKTAIQLGYLVAPYDSYHSIHKPGEEKWITAIFSDISLYDNATISKKNGQKVTGFQNIGRKLNPTLSLPLVKERVENILGTQIPFNSWFIDCDATGEIYDDYSPEHITTEQQDLVARLNRMKYIRDNYNMVIGSEGGHDFATSTIAFAHGIELKSFSWLDDDMKKNKDSKYYIGNYYSPTGGVAEHFSKRIPIKDHLSTIFVDPRYDLPLYKLVYNDSVVTTYHWDWSTFKIIGAVKNRMLREVLYNVPPMYHLDRQQWEKYKEDIIAHTKFWSDFSKQVITKEMTEFKKLTVSANVQMCRYGDNIAVIANFGSSPYDYYSVEIPANSLLLKIDEEIQIYSPRVAAKNQ